MINVEYDHSDIKILISKLFIGELSKYSCHDQFMLTM